MSDTLRELPRYQSAKGRGGMLWRNLPPEDAEWIGNHLNQVVDFAVITPFEQRQEYRGFRITEFELSYGVMDNLIARMDGHIDPQASEPPA